MGIDVVASDRVMDIDIQKDPAQELIIMKSAPLMAITTANAVLSAVVCSVIRIKAKKYDQIRFGPYIARI